MKLTVKSYDGSEEPRTINCKVGFDVVGLAILAVELTGEDTNSPHVLDYLRNAVLPRMVPVDVTGMLLGDMDRQFELTVAEARACAARKHFGVQTDAALLMDEIDRLRATLL